MFNQDTERIIPRKKINILKIGTQALMVLFLLLYIFFDFFAEALPFIPQLSYEGLVVFFLVAIFLLPLSINLLSKWLQTRKWLALADETGFQAEQANRFSIPVLQGTLRGHRIMISQSSQYRGRRRTFFTNVQVTLNEPVKSAFVFKKRGITNFSQTKIGDDEFDKRYSTKTTDERLVGTILRTRRLRLGLLQLGERARTRALTLNHTTLAYIESGDTTDTEYLKAVTGFLSELAHTIERNEQFDF